MSVTIPHVVLTDRYAEAVAYASIIHSIDYRKGTRDENGLGISYMAHLLGVSSLVIEAGGNEDEAIAGLLHDAVEDAGGLPRLEDIRARFQERVAEIVESCSDSTDEEWKKSVGYWDRKQKYLDHLEATNDERAVLVSIADKVHNARAIVTDIKRAELAESNDALSKFNGSAQETLKYYRELHRIGIAKNVPDALTIPLRLTVKTISEYVTAGGK